MNKDFRTLPGQQLQDLSLAYIIFFNLAAKIQNSCDIRHK